MLHYLNKFGKKNQICFCASFITQCLSLQRNQIISYLH